MNESILRTVPFACVTVPLLAYACVHALSRTCGNLVSWTERVKLVNDLKKGGSNTCDIGRSRRNKEECTWTISGRATTQLQITVLEINELLNPSQDISWQVLVTKWVVFGFHCAARAYWTWTSMSSLSTVDTLHPTSLSKCTCLHKVPLRMCTLKNVCPATGVWCWCWVRTIKDSDNFGLLY